MSATTTGPTSAPAAAWKPDLKTALTWGLLAGLSAVAVLPYILRHSPEALARTQMPFAAVAALQGLQAFVLLGLLALFGLRMGHRVGLGSPLLQRFYGAPVDVSRAALRPWHSILLGVVAALAILGLSLVLDPMLPPKLNAAAAEAAPAAKSAIEGFLASFYGGIAEELQLRLFLMTLLVWLMTLAGKHRPKAALVWAAIVIAAIAFGLGHLPMASKIWGLDGFVVFRTVLLNAVGGVVFGWLYWKRGIEMAMLGHFSADIVLHVLAPLAAAPLA